MRADPSHRGATPARACRWPSALRVPVDSVPHCARERQRMRRREPSPAPWRDRFRDYRQSLRQHDHSGQKANHFQPLRLPGFNDQIKKLSRVGYESREPPDETTGEPECPLRRIPFEDATVSKWPGKRPTPGRLEPRISLTDVSLRSLTWPYIPRKFTRPSHLGFYIALNRLFSSPDAPSVWVRFPSPAPIIFHGVPGTISHYRPDDPKAVHCSLFRCP